MPHLAHKRETAKPVDAARILTGSSGNTACLWDTKSALLLLRGVTPERALAPGMCLRVLLGRNWKIAIRHSSKADMRLIGRCGGPQGSNPGLVRPCVRAEA